MELRKLLKNEYPRQLLEIPQPPKELWIMGELPPSNFVYLCIVGSRKHTSYGKDSCQKLIAGLKGYPIAIVSGFAFGIDTIAHQSAIDANLPTIVFPGSGLSNNRIYPRTNFNMVQKILSSGGCFISEFEPNFKATPWAFPMRNRLMAGISKAVLIIEAEEKSGTLITARLATDYNKDVFALPGSIFSTSSKGANKLIRQGAVPITSSSDILEALGFESDNTLKKKEIKHRQNFLKICLQKKKVF